MMIKITLWCRCGAPWTVGDKRFEKTEPWRYFFFFLKLNVVWTVDLLTQGPSSLLLFLQQKSSLHPLFLTSQRRLRWFFFQFLIGIEVFFSLQYKGNFLSNANHIFSELGVWSRYSSREVATIITNVRCGYLPLTVFDYRIQKIPKGFGKHVEMSTKGWEMWLHFLICLNWINLWKSR